LARNREDVCRQPGVHRPQEREEEDGRDHHGHGAGDVREAGSDAEGSAHGVAHSGDVRLREETVAVKENTYYHDEKTNNVFQRSAAGKPGFGPAIRGTLPDIAMAHLCK
jgi:hypothetical protein